MVEEMNCGAEGSMFSSEKASGQGNGAPRGDLQTEISETSLE
jgi:hypothetical protein